MADILYIHPSVRCSLDAVLPMGAVGLMNSCVGTKLGRFHDEVSDEEIAGAKVILMDCHWYPSLLDIHETLIPRIRSINPEARIIVGGYTAGMFARQFITEAGADFVLRGDAEVTLPLLVTRLLEGGRYDDIPNLTSKDGETPLRPTLTPEIYGQQDFLNIDWHPTMSRYADELCHSGMPTMTYPWLPVFKGCLLNCDFCYGNPEKQMLLTGRKAILRPPEAIHRDLQYYHDHPKRFWVHVIADFVTMMPRDYVESVLSRPYDLGIYYEFYNPPKPHQIELLASCFKKCVVTLSMVANHADYPGRQVYIARETLERTLDTISQYPNITTIIQYDSNVVKKVPALFSRLRRLHRDYNVRINAFDEWYLEVPDPKAPESSRKDEYYRFKEKSRRWRYTWFRYINWHLVRWYPSWMSALYWGKDYDFLARLWVNTGRPGLLPVGQSLES